MPNTPRKEDIFDLLFRSLEAGSSSGGILAQEAAGQQSFVNSDTLPTEMMGDSRRVLEEAGIVFLGVVENDPLFQYVELPAGWTKSATGHSMHSDLLDDKGRKRAGIFYKAAFYDRNAHISVNRRFGAGIDWSKLDSGIAQGVVSDCGEIIYRADEISFDTEADYSVRSQAQEQASALAKAWLAERYPDWEDASAYWELGEHIEEPDAQNVERGKWYRVKRNPQSIEAKRLAGQLVGAVEIDSHKTKTVSVFTMSVFQNRGGVAIRIPLSDLTDR